MITVSLHPNNEIRLRSAIKAPSRSRSQSPANLILNSSPISSPSSYFESLGLPVDCVGGSSFSYPSLSPSPAVAGGAPAEGGAFLSLNANFNAPSKPRGGWGYPARRTAFGNSARRSLLRAGGALEKAGYGVSKSDSGRVAFFTGTLPGSTDSAIRALAKWSGYISNRISQYFRRHSIDLWGYAWEWQDRLALHIHLFAASKNKRKLAWLIKGFKKFWIRILLDVCEKSGTDLFARKKGGSYRSKKFHKIIRARGEWCRKSPAAYLASYVSKNAAFKDSSDSKFRSISAEYFPARWWGMSSSLKSLIKKFSSSSSISLSPTQELDLASDIQSLIAPIAKKIYSYQDKYNPDNLNMIFYLDADLWADLKPVLEFMLSPENFASCSLAACAPFASRKIDTSSIDAIIKRRLNNRFIRSMRRFWGSLEYNFSSYIDEIPIPDEDLKSLNSMASYFLSKIDKDCVKAA